MDISAITDYLYIASLPSPHIIPQIKENGVRLILNMIFHRPASEFYEPPLVTKTFSTVDFPLYPIPLSLLLKGVQSAQPVIQNHEAVLIYCKMGRHRSVAMAACILISQGFSAIEAMDLIKRKRPVADPYVWYISRRIIAFEHYWQKQVAST